MVNIASRTLDSEMEFTDIGIYYFKLHNEAKGCIRIGLVSQLIAISNTHTFSLNSLPFSFQ
jgi:hypothetical protein